MNDIQISKNFKLSEFESPDNKEVKLHEKLLELLQELRDEIGEPVIVNSGFRTKEYNDKIGGAKKSKHMEGIASDISLNNLDYSDVELAILIKNIAERIGINSDNLGLGYGVTFLHVDIRGLAGYSSPAEWEY